MQTLTGTLLAAQQAKPRPTHYYLTFSDPLGVEDDVVLSGSDQSGRIIYVPEQVETPDSQTATIYFDNSDNYFTTLNLKGWDVVMKWGLLTSAGVEYITYPPMKVKGFVLYSKHLSLRCMMSFEGIPNRLAKDKASKYYANHWSNPKTVKDLITEIANGQPVDCELTEEQTVSDDFFTLPLTIGTTDTTGAVSATTAKGAVDLPLKNLGTGEICRGTILTIAGDGTQYIVQSTVAIVSNTATVRLSGGLSAQALIEAVVTLAISGSGTPQEIGKAMTISNRTVTKVAFKLKKVGTPTGNITFRISQATLYSDGTVVVGSNLASKTLDAATLTTSAVEYELTFITPELVNERVWLECLYSGGDTTNYICIAINTTAQKANEMFVLDNDSATPDVNWEGDSLDLWYRYKYTAGTGFDKYGDTVTNGVNCFKQRVAYDVVYDSEDALIDTYCPGNGYRIYENGTRLDAINRLLGYTTCVNRVQTDGKIHVFVPKIALATTWTSPTGFTAGPWISEANAYDASTSTVAYETMAAIGWTDYLELTHAALSCDQIKFYAQQTGAVTSIDVDVYDSVTAAWAHVYEGTYTENSWVTKALDKRRTVTKARIRIYDGVNTSWQAQVAEFAFGSDNYDYLYSLGPGIHEFFAKSVRENVVYPNKITVHSYDDNGVLEFSGSATDAASYALDPTEDFIRAKLTSSSPQGDSVAAAMIANLVMNAQSGSAEVPCNLGAEVYDFVLVTDSREADSRTGNLGYIKRSWYPLREFNMSFSFGKRISAPIGGLSNSPNAFPQPEHKPFTVLDLQEQTQETFEAHAIEIDKTAVDLEDLKTKIGFTEGETPTGDQVATALIGFLRTLFDDKTPKLGGNLDANGHYIASDFSPSTDITYSLGDATHKWLTAWVAGIYIGSLYRNIATAYGGIVFAVPNTAGTGAVDAAYFNDGDSPTLDMLTHKIVNLDTDPSGNEAVSKSHLNAFVSLQLSDTLRHSDDTERTSNSLTWAILKEVLIGDDLPVVRVKFDMGTVLGVESAHARIRKNGVAVGTERVQGGAYVTFTDDFIAGNGFVRGDLIQIWGYTFDTPPIDTLKVRNFRFYYDIDTGNRSATNQDP